MSSLPISGHGQSPQNPICLVLFILPKYSGVPQHTLFSLHRIVINSYAIDKNGWKYIPAEGLRAAFFIFCFYMELE